MYVQLELQKSAGMLHRKVAKCELGIEGDRRCTEVSHRFTYLIQFIYEKLTLFTSLFLRWIILLVERNISATHHSKKWKDFWGILRSLKKKENLFYRSLMSLRAMFGALCCPCWTRHTPDGSTPQKNSSRKLMASCKSDIANRTSTKQHFITDNETFIWSLFEVYMNKYVKAMKKKYPLWKNLAECLENAPKIKFLNKILPLRLNAFDLWTLHLKWELWNTAMNVLHPLAVVKSHEHIPHLQTDEDKLENLSASAQQGCLKCTLSKVSKTL